MLAARAQGSADSPDAIAALTKLVTRPDDVFAAEGYLQTGVIVSDVRKAKPEWAPALAALPSDATAAYDAVIQRRGGTGLAALLAGATPSDTTRETDLPDLSLMWAGKYGRFDFKGGIKLVSRSNALVTVKDQNLKGKASAITAGFENGKAKITQAIGDLGVDFERLPWPLDSITPKFQTKFLDLKNMEELKIATFAFKVVGDLPDELVPDFIRKDYKLVIEGSLETGITPADLGSLTKLKSLTERAVEQAAELVKWQDKLRVAEQEVAALAARKKELEVLVKETAPKFVRGAVKEAKSYRIAAEELQQVSTRLLQFESDARLAAENAGRLGKIFSRLYEEWVVVFGEMSPVLLRLRGPLTEWVCEKLAVIVGSQIFKYAHPILMISMLAWDLAHLAKFIIDLCRGTLTYKGWGKGDYEPSLLDWSGAPDKDQPKQDGTTGGATQGDGDKQKPRDRLTGPRARLAAIMTTTSTGEQMTPAQVDRLRSILESAEITNADVDRILADVTIAKSVDDQLDRLERALRPPEQPKTTTTTGGGGGTTPKPAPKRKPPQRSTETPGTIRPDGTEPLTGPIRRGSIYYSPKTNQVYIQPSWGGGAIRLPGVVEPRRDGSFVFHPRPDLVGTPKIKNGKGEGEVKVEREYVFR